MLSDVVEARPPGRRSAAADAVRPAATEALQARLRAIVAESPTPEEALEPALHAILEAAGSAAGAILFFDQRAEVLRLAAEVGLSDEGCRRLRTVRRGDTLSWDMPLQSLFNRRAYLIESAARNRYVPPLVEQAAAVRTIACLPLFVGATALGSLVVVTLAPQSLSERDIRTLEAPLRELMRLIETVRQRPTAAAPSAPAPSPVLRPHAPLPTERTPAVAGAGDSRMDVRAREEALADARERIAALEASAAAARAEPGSRGEDVRALRTALAAAEARVAEQAAALMTAEARAAEQAAALAAAEARTAEQAAARAAAHERIPALEAEVAAGRAEIERLVAAAMERARATEAASAGELESLRGMHAAEIVALTARVEELAGEAGRVGATAAENAALMTRVAELTDERDRLQAAADALERAHERIVALEAEVAAGRTEIERLASEATEHPAAAAAGTDERAALRATHAAGTSALMARLAELSDERACIHATAAVLAEALPEPAGAPAAIDETADVVQAAAPAAATEAAADPPASACAATESGPVVVVLDTEPAWESVSVNNHRVVVRRPPELQAGSAGALVVNLATAGALDALAGLRTAGHGGPIWACVADPAAGRALPIGVIEPTPRPLDPDVALVGLARHVTRGARVVTVGTDVDVLVSLRQALARQGISVSMAWDAKQAVDLFAMVHPELVVLDLALPHDEGYRLLARLGAADPVPTVLLVPGDDDGAGFAKILADATNAPRVVPLERIVAAQVARERAAAR